MVVERSESRAFKPRARLLRLLGDELIRDPNIAIFELVKNAYDADASYARVEMANVHDHHYGIRLYSTSVHRSAERVLLPVKSARFENTVSTGWRCPDGSR